MNVVKSISYDNTDIHCHNMPDSAIIILCVTSLTNVRKSNRNFVVSLRLESVQTIDNLRVHGIKMQDNGDVDVQLLLCQRQNGAKNGSANHVVIQKNCMEMKLLLL